MISPKYNPKHIQQLKEGKPPMEYIPYAPLEGVARVLKTGADKYGIRNWRQDEILASTYVGAITRHALLEWAQGVDKDKDSGEHPLAHVVACCLLVMDAEKHGTLIDDRLTAESISNQMEDDEPASEPESEWGEWIDWGGGEIPVSGTELVTVIYRGGITATCTARIFSWRHYESGYDIIRYRVKKG